MLLDISCQQLGDECKLGMNVVGAGDTFLKIYISVGNNDNRQPRNNDTPMCVIWNK